MENLYKDNEVKMKIIFVLLLTFTFPFSVVAANQCENIGNLTAFKTKLQQKVKQMRDDLVQQYALTCDADIMNCTTRSYNFCVGTGKRSCLSNFPTPSTCFSNGLWLSVQSGVRVSNALPVSNLSDKARKFICASARIQKTFHQLSQSNERQYTYSYIGSSSGAIRVSPSFKQQNNASTNQCTDYDPRRRPWYVSAITGAKITVILFDISKTMTSLPPGARYSNAKLTFQIILQTLNSFDQLGVVVFSRSARTVVFNKIVSASDENKDPILNYIQNLSTQQGYTNYTAAFDVGVSMLSGVQTTCQDVIFLLLTDGYNENDQISTFNFSFYSNYLNSSFISLGKEISSLKLISFVYGVQSNINYTLVKYLTCAYQGMVFRMWDGIDYYTMIEKLTNYYTFLSSGINKTNISPTWSQFYLDAFGFGMIVSVTMPIFFGNQIIGVAGIDVMLSKFQQCGYDLDYIQTYLAQKPQCFSNNMLLDQLMYLRCSQGNTTCSDNNTCNQFKNKTIQQLCDSNITLNVFYDDVVDSNLDSDRCCGITWTRFIAIIVGSSIGVVVTIVVFVLYVKGVFHRICQRNKVKNMQRGDSQDGSEAGLLGNNLLTDPQKKYKRAQESGIIIFREQQFSI